MTFGTFLLFALILIACVYGIAWICKLVIER